MAAGDVIEARVYGPDQPGTSTGVLYTVPASRRVVLKQVVLANTSAGAATVTLGIGGTAAADQIVPAVSIPANTVETLDCSQVLEAAETIDGLQGTGAAITVTISAYVVEL